MKTLLLAIVVFLLATFPATWLMMLFLGNTGVNVSVLGDFPLDSRVRVARRRSRRGRGHW